MTTDPTFEMADWIEQVRGTEPIKELRAAWAEFERLAQPVATLFGAYDTGKSSIVRRLAVESGTKVPDWLTVSALHETYSANLLELDGLWLRDTPGLSPGGDDLRSLGNSSTARHAAALTDLLLVTLNPQLATGELPEIQRVLAQDWPDGTVWFLISRADEGGIDPDLDPDGFASWANLKRKELRESLDLAESARIFVLIPDYGQLGNYSPKPDPSLWDISRKWDGIAELRTALADWASNDPASARGAARARFWTGAVLQTLVDMRAEQTELATSLEAARVALQRRDLFLKQIETMRRTAEVSLEAKIEEAVNRTLTLPVVDADAIKRLVEPVLEDWWDAQHAELARITHDAISTFEQQRERPAWQVLRTVYGAFTPLAGDVQAAAPRVTPIVTGVVKNAALALKGVDDVLRAQEKLNKPLQAATNAGTAASKAKALGKFGVIAEATSAALPFLAEIGNLLDEVRIENAQRDQTNKRRRQLSDQVHDIARNAANQVLGQFQPYIEELRQQVKDAAGITEAEVETLTAATDEVERLIQSGTDLVSRRDKEG